HVITTSDDNAVRLWDTDAGRPITPPLRHGESVMSTVCSADGRRLVTVCQDQVVRTWDISNDGWTNDDLLLLSRLYAGQSLDLVGYADPLSSHDVATAFYGLCARHPEAFTV